MKQEIKIGQQDYSVLVFIPDPASTDGSGKTGLNAAALTCSYARVETDNDVTVTDVTSSLNDLSALTDSHADWGVKEVSSSLAPGLYRLDIADAVFLSGAWSAVVYIMITSSAAAASPMEFVLIPELPSVNVAQISGDGTAADNLKTAFDGGAYNVGGGAVVAASVTGSVGSVTNGVVLADDAITANKFDESTAFPLKSADTGSTAVARAGADSDTLKTLSDQLDAVPTDTENADALLTRDLGSGTGAGTLNERTVRAALRFLRNKWTLADGTLTVTKEDDTTTAWTGAASTSGSADPVVGVDPT